MLQSMELQRVGHNLVTEQLKNNPGGFGEEFYSSGSRAGLTIMIRACTGLALF